MKEPKILTYDIETTPLLAWIWRLGKQVVRHDQLHDDWAQYNIICIGYKWMHEREVHVLQWDKKHNSSKMIEEFDKVIEQADIIVGQNSDSFDYKHINAQRLMHGLDPLPNWAGVTFEDTLKMARKYFNFPSNKLDYFSKHLLGRGGKIKMELSDWVHIVTKSKEAPKAMAKMIKYQKKDVLDGEATFKLFRKHCLPKLNRATFSGQGHACIHCGGNNLHKRGLAYSGTSVYQQYHCNDCRGYAGRHRMLDTGGESRKIMK